MKKETPPAPSVPEEESGLTEEALERKARELYQRVQAYAEKKEQGSPDGVETKYAKSLEDLKQEYSDWMHKKKRSGNRRPIVINKKAIGLTAMVAVVFLAGFIFAQWLNRDSIKVQPISDNKVMSLQSDKNSVASQKKVNPPVTDPGSAGDINDEPGITEQALYDQPVGKEPKGNGPAPASKASIQKNKNNQQQSGQQEVSSLIEKYTGKAVTTTSNATEQPAEPPKAKLPLSQLVSMNGRYMKDNEKKNITGLEITVMNNSDEVVRSVAVKVSYHKKGGREFDTETVYVNNIHPHTPFTISRPGNKKAHSATFQIIQIQGE